LRNSICKDQIKNKEVHGWKQTMCYDIAGGFAIRDFDFDSMFEGMQQTAKELTLHLL